MKDITTQSLGELKALYTRKIQHFTAEKLAAEKKIDQCRREIKAAEGKLRHIEALVGGAAAAPKAAATKAPRRRGRKRRPRSSPVKIATLQALRNRPGQRLTTRQLLAAIRHDTGKRVSRQSVNVNLGLLEKEKSIQRFPAPRGAGARFVYSALPRT